MSSGAVMAKPSGSSSTPSYAAAAAAPSASSELVQTFRQKAAFMKTWRPASQPSNRDRLELYAWHKQAVSGDAPAHLLGDASLSAQEKAKYAAWRGKHGTAPDAAMRHYLTESERQVRVYGLLQQPTTAAANGGGAAGSSTPQLLQNGARSTQSQQQQPQATHSRGLAAIPLLCAAASEQRAAYLRRLQTAPTAWWRRQEPLAAHPGSFRALPETLLLAVAAALERVALHFSNTARDANHAQAPPVLGVVVQSALWPLHNALLALWMALILVSTVLGAAADLGQTVVLGSRRTGRTLAGIWQDDVALGRQSVRTLTEPHQPVAARCVGLLMQPFSLSVAVAEGLLPNTGSSSYLWRSVLFGACHGVLLAWYWWCVLPWILVVPFLGTALGLGGCFALIELAAHV